MHICRLIIKNFRCIRDLDISLSPISVLIGENNAGKSAVLDAVKIAFGRRWGRSEEHTSELQSLMRISYAVFCLKKKNTYNNKSLNCTTQHTTYIQTDIPRDKNHTI